MSRIQLREHGGEMVDREKGAWAGIARASRDKQRFSSRRERTGTWGLLSLDPGLQATRRELSDVAARISGCAHWPLLMLYGTLKIRGGSKLVKSRQNAKAFARPRQSVRESSSCRAATFCHGWSCFCHQYVASTTRRPLPKPRPTRLVRAGPRLVDD